MSKPRRISAGGLVFKGNEVLLVRYQDQSGVTFLVGPGGGLEDDENVVQAVIREVWEETGVTVEPKRVVAIEDLQSERVKTIKVWLVCEVVAGEVQRTVGADMEGITAAGWFTRDQLAGEIVFPSFLMQHDWERLRTEIREVECLPSRVARFQ